MSDEAVAHVLQALIVALLVIAAIVFAIGASAPDSGAGEAQRAYEQKERQVYEILDTGTEWCCSRDPSASSLLENLAMRAWNGEPGPLVETFEPWFVDPETTEFTVKASWAPRGGHGTHTVDLYRSAPSHGKTAGHQQLAQPAPQGPAFVVPRLDKISAEASADLLAVPVENLWPYRTGPRGAHTDQIATEIVYQRTSPGDSLTRTVEMEGHTELTGSARPAVDVQFQEPDWQRLDAENERLEVDTSIGDPGRTFTQTLTKDDLAAERSLHEDGAFNDSEELDDGEYPHHRFHVQVNVSGPGAIDAGTVRTASDGEVRRDADAYKLTVYVPRNWTEVVIKKPDDEDFNDRHNWTRMSVRELPSGGHRITSFLNVTAEFDVSGTRNVDRPRWVLNDSAEIQAPFRFHARPPSDAASTELGFQDVEATVESARFAARETSDLTVEVASSPGRVHRTLNVHTPSLIPPTPWANEAAGIPEGVTLPIGATLKNGGEAAEVEQITWTIPQASSPPRELTVLEDYTDSPETAWSWTEDNGTLTITWSPNLTEADTTCGQLEACSVAAELVVDGRGLTQRPLWAPPQLTSLYAADDVQPFLDWFVRSEDAWEGRPVERAHRPGFALGHRHRVAEAGPTEGAYRFTVPPTLDPACEDEIRQRDRAERHRRDDRVYFDFGPREDGLPQLGLGCERSQRRFTAIAEMGRRYNTDAIGKHAYRSVAELSGQTVSSWQNGLAESWVEARDHVPAGGSLDYRVKMDSLLDVLAHDDDVGNATLEAHLVDPYNAWENDPWGRLLIRENTGFGEAEADVFRAISGDAEHGGDGCDVGDETDDDCPRVDTGDPIPPRFRDEIWIPKDTVPGTHLLILELSWQFTTVGGTEITETGRLIEPFDVLSPDGDRVQGTAIGMTAWDTDWR